MQDLIERPQDEGCYIVDRRTQSVEDSVNQLTDHLFTFCSKTRRQRINQRNRVERLSPLLDWKNLGIEYSKARQLAIRRAYPDAFYGPEGANGVEDEWEFGGSSLGLGAERMGVPSVPASPKFRGTATPGDIGTLTEEVSGNPCSGFGRDRIYVDAITRHERLPWRIPVARHCGRRRWLPIVCALVSSHPAPPLICCFPSPLIMKVRSRASSVMSGASTPGGGKFNTLSEVDLRRADAALQNVDYNDDDEGDK